MQALLNGSWKILSRNNKLGKANQIAICVYQIWDDVFSVISNIKNLKEKGLCSKWEFGLWHSLVTVFICASYNYLCTIF